MPEMWDGFDPGGSGEFDWFWLGLFIGGNLFIGALVVFLALI